MATAKQISVERTSPSTTEQQIPQQPAARHARSVFFMDATQEQENEADTMVHDKKRRRRRKTGAARTLTQDDEAATQLGEQTATGPGPTPTPTPRTEGLSTYGCTRKNPPRRGELTKLPRESPSNNTLKKPPTVRTPATCVEPEQLPRAPKGHHEEELQEMEEILNEMTLPQTMR
ncbi:hypothetical protein TELCIR_10847 [Teladorsagia circumcincta]|uniref:Uncharacterized protein n=1 Tax=Teladorsagia circumcincta TaxID=45464 RepID=A0A2G9UAY4_TELCI|nr:hypothetical protein TELCIR_10847 [Teladorsagia circumcincta]